MDLHLDEDNIEILNSTRRIYTLTPDRIRQLYEPWDVIENVNVLRHISSVAGLIRRYENGIDWYFNVKTLLKEYEIGCLEIEDIRKYYEKVVGGPVVPVGGVENDHARVLIDYELNYYISPDHMLWSNGNGFNDFLRYQDGRKKFIPLK